MFTMKGYLRLSRVILLFFILLMFTVPSQV